MTAFLLSPRAQADLDEIWTYSAARWGEDRTERYIRDLWRTFERLAEDARIGRSCDEIRPGYFKCPAGSHVVFYRRDAGIVDVVRILHERMDFERHL